LPTPLPMPDAWHKHDVSHLYATNKNIETRCKVLNYKQVKEFLSVAPFTCQPFDLAKCFWEKNRFCEFWNLFSQCCIFSHLTTVAGPWIQQKIVF
jgi:hypothetical protein